MTDTSTPEAVATTAPDVTPEALLIAVRTLRSWSEWDAAVKPAQAVVAIHSAAAILEALAADRDAQKARADAAERERDELATKLEAITSGDWSKARLVRFENGQFDFTGGPVAFIAEYLAQLMESGDEYYNNMEVRVDHPKAGPMVLTLQRVLGKTPTEQRKAAEANVAKLVEAMRGLLEAYESGWSDKQDWGAAERARAALAEVQG